MLGLQVCTATLGLDLVHDRHNSTNRATSPATCFIFTHLFFSVLQAEARASHTGPFYGKLLYRPLLQDCKPQVWPVSSHWCFVTETLAKVTFTGQAKTPGATNSIAYNCTSQRSQWDLWISGERKGVERNRKRRGWKKCLRGLQDLLLLQKTRTWFPAPTWWLSTTCNSDPWRPSTLFWPSWTLHTPGAQTYMQVKHPHT